MNISEHSDILKAYVGRISLQDMRNILEAYEGCWQEQNNGNRGSQHHADIRLDTAIREAMGKMLSSDRDNITTIIGRKVNRQ